MCKCIYKNHDYLHIHNFFFLDNTAFCLEFCNIGSKFSLILIPHSGIDLSKSLTVNLSKSLEYSQNFMYDTLLKLFTVFNFCILSSYKVF